MKKIYPFLLFGLPLFAGSPTENIIWNGPGGDAAASILAVLVIAILVFIGFTIFLNNKRKTDIRSYNWTKFNEYANNAKLASDETVLLKKLVGYRPRIEPQVIFQSITLFEKCINAYVEEILQRHGNDSLTELANKTLYSIREKLGYNHLALEHPLVSSRNIEIGQRGVLFGSHVRAPLIKKIMVTSTNEFTFHLSYNTETEDVVYISPGDSVKFAFTRQNDSVYGVELKVASVSEENGNIVVFHSMNLKRNQLRKYMRVELSLPLKFRLLGTRDQEKSEFERGEVSEAKFSDIGGGGISFLCERSLRVGDLVSLNFKLPNVTISGVSGKVLRISLREGRTKTLYKHHIKFEKIEPRQREQIVKYVFEKQRKQSQWR